MANIIPLLKSGDVNDASNFRAIALLLILAKIIEKIIAITITKYFTSNNGAVSFNKSYKTLLNDQKVY